MNYNVIWNDTSRRSLQRIFDAELDKEGVLHTVARIGLELSSQPQYAGESREQGVRILFKHPLVVWYEVNERLKNVIVFQVRRLRN